MTSPSDSTDEGAAAVLAAREPQTVVVDGTAYRATRVPTLGEALPFIAAMETAAHAEEGQVTIPAMLQTAQDLLVCVGIPPEVVQRIPLNLVTETAGRFFGEVRSR